MSTEINHSTLAMRAAKRMRRVKHKRKNGHVICHHLMMMLDDQQMHPSAGSAVGTRNIGIRNIGTRNAVKDLSGMILKRYEVADRMEGIPAGVLAERQYSLGLSL